MKTIPTDMNKEKKKRTVIWLFFLVYVAVLLRLTVFRPGFGTYEHFSGKLNLELFTNYIPIIAEGHWFDFIYLFFGNIVWFIPWGLFFRAYLKQPARVSIISGTMLSVLIETLQYVFTVGDAELDDVILNTAGTVIGSYIGSTYLRLQRKKNQGKTMILDGYWKTNLVLIKKSISFWSNLPIDGIRYIEHKISQGMLYSAAIIRKAYEEEFDTEKECKEKGIRIPDLYLLEMRVPIMEYEHIDSDKFFMNSKVFLSDYDIKNGTMSELSIKQVCNQIIHSYVWSVVHLEKGKIYGVLFASDMYKEKAVYLIEIKEWIKIIQEVIEKSVL